MQLSFLFDKKKKSTDNKNDQLNWKNTLKLNKN